MMFLRSALFLVTLLAVIEVSQAASNRLHRRVRSSKQMETRATSLAAAKTEKHRLLFAGYNGVVAPYTLVYSPGGKSDLRPTIGVDALNNTVGAGPGWITFSNELPSSLEKVAYIMNETSQAEVNTVAYIIDGESPGRVYSVDADKVDNLKVEGKAVKTGGDGAVNSCKVGNILFVANYGSGSAVTFDLDPTTHLLTSKAPEATFQFHRSPEGSIGPVTSRQDHSYAHQVQPDPTGRWVYVCDLGADRIWRIKVPSSGKAAEVKRVGHTVVAEGSGPRHISFYHDSKTNQSYGYLASELSTHLTAFKVNSTNGALDMIGQSHLAVPKGTPLGGNKKDGPKRTTSEVAISPDGKVVYVGTRGDAVEDHVSIFDRDTTTGAVQWREWVASGGRNLRHFSLSLDTQAKFLAAAHQDTGNVTILLRDITTGGLKKIPGATAKGLTTVAFAGWLS